MTLSTNDIATLRSLQLQAMDGGNNAIRARVKLVRFICEDNPVAFRDCLDMAEAGLRRKERQSA